MTNENKELTRRQVREVREVMLDLADCAKERGYDNSMCIYPDTILRLAQALGVELRRAGLLTVNASLFFEKPSTKTKVLVEKAKRIVGIVNALSDRFQETREGAQDNGEKS